MQRRIGLRRSVRSGFTLIEMLIVIAIIGILAAILFPVFGRVRENGRSAACSSNLKQIGLAFQQYVSDNGQRYPGGGQFQSWGNGGHWVRGQNGAEPTGGELTKKDGDVYVPTGKQADVETGALAAYTKNPGIYVCPSNQYGQQKRLSYAMNCALGGLNQSRNTNPTDIILIVDEENNNDGYFWAADTNASTDAATKIHNGNTNYLFTDGHVKSIPFDSFPVDSANSANKGVGANPAVRPKAGSPRFHDISFGPRGSAFPFIFGKQNPDGTLSEDALTSDSCGLK